MQHMHESVVSLVSYPSQRLIHPSTKGMPTPTHLIKVIYHAGHMDGLAITLLF